MLQGQPSRVPATHTGFTFQDVGSGLGGAEGLVLCSGDTGQPRLSPSYGFCGTWCQQELETMATGRERRLSNAAALIPRWVIATGVIVNQDAKRRE